MSGICGFIRLDGASAAHAQVNAMLAAMRQRGPDRQRSWRADSVALGQTLLATTPEATAETQPWVHAESGCVVVSDSRLDNRQALLRTLEFAHGPVDRIGDGALLHAAYQRWGEGCAAHLLGDFAFAIWDLRQRKLFCARDQMGVRPFYFHHAPGQLFAFASEPEALLHLPDVPAHINEVRIVDFLVPLLEGFDATSTFYQAIQRMPAAHTFTVEAARLVSRRYWVPTDDLTDSMPRNDEECADALRALLAQAVHCRVRSSAKVGSMLSGGLDSSTIVALASAELARTGNGPLPTFSAINSAGACAETAAIRQMLALPGLAPTLFDIADTGAPWDALEAHRVQMREPFDGSMTLVASQYVAAQRSGVRVILDGIDADTLFSAGTMLARLLRAGRWPTALREARGIVHFHNDLFSIWTVLRSDLAAALVPGPLLRLRKRVQLAYLTRRRFPSSLIAADFSRRAQLPARLAAQAAQGRYVHGDTSVREHALEIASPWVATGLERYGRVAAAHACEPRHPFMDRRLLGFALALPNAQRQRDGWPKWIMRRAMEDALPEQICWRRGKEHLGWRSSRALLERLDEPRLRELVDDHATLEPYLNMPRLQQHLQHWLKDHESESSEPLYAATVLHGWLKRTASIQREAADRRSNR